MNVLKNKKFILMVPQAKSLSSRCSPFLPRELHAFSTTEPSLKAHGLETLVLLPLSSKLWNYNKHVPSRIIDPVIFKQGKSPREINKSLEVILKAQPGLDSRPMEVQASACSLLCDMWYRKRHKA